MRIGFLIEVEHRGCRCLVSPAAGARWPLMSHDHSDRHLVDARVSNFVPNNLYTDYRFPPSASLPLFCCPRLASRLHSLTSGMFLLSLSVTVPRSHASVAFSSIYSDNRSFKHSFPLSLSLITSLDSFFSPRNQSKEPAVSSVKMRIVSVFLS